MKRGKFLNIGILSMITLMVVSMSSCLKDDRFVDFSSSPPLVEFPLAGYASQRAQAVAIVTTGANKNTDASGKYQLTVAVNLASAETLGNDVTVTVAVDNSMLTAAGTSTTTPSLPTPANTSTPMPAYYPLPAAAYTISNLKPVIAAGQRLAYFTVTIDPAVVGTSVKNYALRLVIKDASGVHYRDDKCRYRRLTALLIQKKV